MMRMSGINGTRGEHSALSQHNVYVKPTQAFTFFKFLISSTFVPLFLVPSNYVVFVLSSHMCPVF